jgi:transposase
MARRRFEVLDVVEIYQHWDAGRPKAVIADSLGVDVKTVRKYVRLAEQAGISPGVGYSREEWSGLVRAWCPELVDARQRSSTYALIAPYKERIEEMLSASTVTTVHQRLRDEDGLSVGISSFRRYCWAEFPDQGKRELASPPRPDVSPGEEAQVDYGYLGRIFDPVAERWKKVWAFVMVLAFSRHMFVRPVLKMDQAAWTECHVAAFSYFGAVPHRLVIDNLKTGVLKPDIYDPKLNRSYAELAAHYRLLVDPARAAKPKDKPRVERQMPYVRDSFFSGRDFADVAQMAGAAVVWTTEVAGRRPHRSLDGARPVDLFSEIELPAMGPLPLISFELARWSRPKVGPDCFVKVGRALYTVNWSHIGKVLDARESTRTVEVFDGDKVVKTWPRIERGRQIDYGDYPPEKVAFFMKNPAWCRHRAKELGGAAEQVIESLLEGGALYNLRAAQGVIRMADKYGTARLQAACEKATLAGDPAYRTIRNILQAGVEDEEEEVDSVPSAPAHLHGSEQLFSHLEAGEAR